ncbi:unnamed protein product [Nesidiocoris tenuis]|uniref:VLRF1 domain-containing protein n=1 Tax=Nesidiocoris tenuis TaxID=355587 RepID=A0A6H5HQ47_9HEMI|nr:unnamed protein product [Nesidiocoris tenuis]
MDYLQFDFGQRSGHFGQVFGQIERSHILEKDLQLCTCECAKSFDEAGILLQARVQFGQRAGVRPPFAGCCDPVLHKTFHSYTVRKAQGGTQSSKDNKDSNDMFKSTFSPPRQPETEEKKWNSKKTSDGSESEKNCNTIDKVDNSVRIATQLSGITIEGHWLLNEWLNPQLPEKARPE